MKRLEMESTPRLGHWAEQSFQISNSLTRRPRGTPLTKENTYALSPFPDFSIHLCRGTTGVENESHFSTINL
jgi:hypothetical protein